MNKHFLLSLIIIFAVITGVSYGLQQYNAGFNFITLMIANALLFTVTLLAHIIAMKSIQDRPQAFVRGVFSGTIVKLFTCMFGILIYALLNKGHIYKPVVFAFFGIYVLYSVAETWVSSRAAKKMP